MAGLLTPTLRFFFFRERVSSQIFPKARRFLHFISPIIAYPAEKLNPTNTGFILLFRTLDWSLGLERLRMLSGPPNFFTNQTVTHLCMHANNGLALDPGKFVLQLDDQFIYRDRYAGHSLAMRHYVNPVRHKFWTALARRSSQ